jgi:hypothetical protein
MNKKVNKIRVYVIAIIVVAFGILLPTSTGYSQSYLRINDEIGGGGGGSVPQSDNSDNSAVYIVGGLIVVGVITYLVINKNKKKNEEADTTSSLNGLNSSDFAVKFNDIEHKIEKAKEDLPVDLFIGVRNNKAFISDKTYLMGVSVKF